VQRTTEIAPTKSGIIGMLAAARGMRRTDPLTDLLGLSFGVRIDQPGELIRDFQTARSLDGKRTMPLSYRYYLGDAVFAAAIEGEHTLLAGLHEALQRPHFPLYLGRRSCPPSGPVSLGVHDGNVTDALHSLDWQASKWHMRRGPKTVRLQIIRDAKPGELKTESIRDEPLSFDSSQRDYAWRLIVRDHVDRPNPHSTASATVSEHDPMAMLGV
jgi:CRISPR system Cascade subunit CasD